MRDYLSEDSTQQTSVFWCILVIIGLFVAEWIRVLPSIGVAGLFLTALAYAVKQRKIAQKRSWKSLLSISSIFALHVVSDLARGNIADKLVQQDLVLQLPFLLLPISFLLLPSWPAHYKRCLWLVLIGCCLFAAGGATVNYLLHSQQIERLYLQSKVMPTEPDHIRFSLLISIAVLMGLILLSSKGLKRELRRLLIIGVGLLFLFQHLLAVRSGLVSMYIAGIVWLCWLGVQQKRWQAAVSILGISIALSAISLMSFPTLQNKITNTRSDTDRIETVQAANNYSVTARVYSYDVAWALVRLHPWLGVGKIELANQMAVQYSYKFPEIQADRYILPHNQFIYNLTAYGVIGLIIFLFGFYYPLLSALRDYNISFLLIYLIVTVSFVVEYTLESHIGVLIGSFFGLLSLAPTAKTTVHRSIEIA